MRIFNIFGKKPPVRVKTKMKVYYGFDDLPRFRNPVVTVGSYDGVHAGHRKLLDSINRMARENDGQSVVVTFSPHPREVLPDGNGIKLLSSPREKARLLEQAGVDNLIIAPFTTEFSRLSSYDFVKRYLLDKIGVHTLVVGYNHHFGRGKEGDFDYLVRMGSRFGFDIYMIPRYDMDDEKVSSTVIRDFIAAGDVRSAAKFLGYPYFIIGRVSDGGVLEPESRSKLLPPAGTYPVEVTHGQGVPLSADLRVGEDGGLRLEPPPPAGTDVTVTFV